MVSPGETAATTNTMNTLSGDLRALPRTAEVIARGIAAGLHTGAQVYVSVAGKQFADAGVGEVRPGVAMTSHIIMPWKSSCKPVAAVAIAQLWERGMLELDDPAVRFIPEFGARGKEIITIRHLLTHTAGFRTMPSHRPEAAWEDIIAGICAMPREPDWIPGRRAGYHQESAWYILAEIVRRIVGRPYDRYVREEIFEPLGMRDSWIALPEERYRAYGDRLGDLFVTESDTSVRLSTHAGMPGFLYNPAGSGRGPVRELGRFYEMLLLRGVLDGVRILLPQTVEALTARHRVGLLDHTFNHVMDWSLGFILDSKMYGPDTVPYGYGPYCSPRTFGHSGYQSSVGYCDPERTLVVALVVNGTPGERRHRARFHALNAAIYEDIGFVE